MRGGAANVLKGKVMKQTEKSVQRDVKRLYHNVGGRVYDTSQPFRAFITPGVPDLVVYMPRVETMFFHEVKTPMGKLTDPQKGFIEIAESCGQRVIVGGVPAALEILYELQIIVRQGMGELIPIYQGSQVGWIVNKRTACWDWIGAVAPNGYGRVGVLGTKNRTAQAHRVVYEREKGSVDKALDLDHLCRNRRCVNPAHLEPVTRTENSHRGDKTLFTEQEVDEIRERYAKGDITQRELGREYGMDHGYISQLITRKRRS